MAAQLLARYLAARGIHYGWVIVAITFSFVVCSSAAMSVAGVLVPKISQEFGWSIGEISGPLAFRLALFGIMAPFAGALMLRYGLRTVVTGSATLLIAGLVVSILMTAKWQLWLGIGVLLGVAAGMTALVLSATVATRWFTARRGLVLGVMGVHGNRAARLSARRCLDLGGLRLAGRLRALRARHRGALNSVRSVRA